MMAVPAHRFSLSLLGSFRLVGPDGAIYQILEYSQAERIDVLPMVSVALESSGS